MAPGVPSMKETAGENPFFPLASSINVPSISSIAEGLWERISETESIASGISRNEMTQRALEEGLSTRFSSKSVETASVPSEDARSFAGIELLIQKVVKRVSGGSSPVLREIVSDKFFVFFY